MLGSQLYRVKFMQTKKHIVHSHHQESEIFNRRSVSLTVLTALFILIIIARLISLQIIQHHQYSTLSRKNLIAVIPLPPNRGLIYDRNGILLAKNTPSYNLMLTPYKVKNIKKTIEKIRKVIPFSKQDIKIFYRNLKAHRRFSPIPLKLNLSEKLTDIFYVNRYNFPGITIKTSLIRSYPQKKYLSSIIGYVGRINKDITDKNYQGTELIGKIGIEKYYENILHGTVGYAIAIIDANGDIVRYIKKTPPINGKNITLNIDSRLQEKAYKLMKGNSGSIIAMNPKNGNIIAMVSTPSYDANPFVTGISQKAYTKLTHNPQHPLFNRSIRGLYSPGSTIKPFLAYSALMNHTITPNTTIWDPGWFKLPNTKHIFHDWKFSGHGHVNVSKAIIVSCDTFFYNLAEKLGIKELDKSLYSFGFGRPTRIDLGEELPGIVPSPGWEIRHKHHTWYTGDTIITGIGQGSLVVTPIQLAVATSMLAERGQRITPHLLHIPGVIERNITNKYQDNTLENKAWKTVTNAMSKVISSPEGTAINFSKKTPYTVSGKTGTVQIFKKTTYKHINVSTIPKKLRNNHLFIAFAPTDHPQIAVAVIVEHASDADGIAQHVIDDYFKTVTAYKRQNKS
jgi:penicillin-binding protein 2